MELNRVAIFKILKKYKKFMIKSIRGGEQERKDLAPLLDFLNNFQQIPNAVKA